ncbi:MAG: hypothetical protein UR28_C0019G0020 [Candidatus Peregrinibacteria bacterium GW2011_GWF2_33_10]|nr:MAG: hypothetical protein UR28_C0019G0020 [Candidatus Peregrinibacteria bacterium GW2011_GWF2_33_10]OGJ43983.1 MAG: hypothetical protein A2272_05115 [Candidatus Peregrinibacteria bacterium RIFOXYA12_FULL_33_12]OGJ45519.1 MAG: hypothetical protein A2263_05970 [Candidatus Peregrinibacteria bacterium RIFOXYA2_FULL_33_21]OGJ50006.1 MAG: hypothetical protein A2307_04530 [Candidatus Peregrinibacteria bacterium RIFOXYB2_FULL_33_20]
MPDDQNTQVNPGAQSAKGDQANPPVPKTVMVSGQQVTLPGVDPEFEAEDLKGYLFDPNNFEQKYDDNGKPMRPNFSVIVDQQKRIEAKQAYLDALNKYIAEKKVQIAQFEAQMRKNEEIQSKEEDEAELAKLDQMLNDAIIP